MAKNDDQDGSTPNVEGRHGDKTHAAFLENIHHAQPETEAPDEKPRRFDGNHPSDGRHRLDEDRQQHDEAEKNSEANRLRR